jgi:hypothetical protein
MAEGTIPERRNACNSGTHPKKATNKVEWFSEMLMDQG